MSPREIDDVKKIIFSQKFVENGLVGQYTCQVLSCKYYLFRNNDAPPPPPNLPFKSPVLIALLMIF